MTSKKETSDLEDRLQALTSALKQKEKEIYSIQRIGRALSSTLKLDDLLRLIMQEITVLMDADRSTLFLVDKNRGEIWSKIALKAEVKEIRQKLGKGISGHVAQTGETINIPDAYNDPRFDPSTDKRTGYRTRSILCMPVWEPLSSGEQREIMGVIQVLNKKDGHFTEEDEALLETLASQVAISIANSRLYHQLEEKYQEIDLLYDFEQQLSEVYELPRLLHQLLAKTLSHLGAQWVLAAFPMENRIVFVGAGPQGEAVYDTHGRVHPDWLHFMQYPSLEALQQNAEWLQSYFRLEKALPLQALSVLFSPMPMGEGRAGVLMALGIETGDFEQLEDRQKMVDLVAQKIIRAVELHNLRESLIKRERLSAIGQMLSTIVHDIRGPVNTIYGFMDLVADEATTPEERREFSRIIRQEIQSLMNMVTEVLDFAKGKTSILPRKTSVKKLMERFKPRLEQMCRSFQTRLHLNVQSRQILYADEEKLVRVFYNITKNAIEAMGDGGEMFIRIQDDDGYVVFEFQDTGPGIPPEIQEKLFESFVTGGKKSGTGLGLAIVKKIVDEHRGHIELESAMGKGATFRIKIPVMSKET